MVVCEMLTTKEIHRQNGKHFHNRFLFSIVSGNGLNLACCSPGSNFEYEQVDYAHFLWQIRCIFSFFSRNWRVFLSDCVKNTPFLLKHML